MPAPIVAYWEALPVWITFGLAVLAALLVATAIWWLWWRLPKREAARLALKIRDAKARADVEDNYRKTVGQALGGIAVLLGAGLAYLQFSGQQQASHDLLISNQVSKGFEQLGSEKLVVRLGGIYALEGVMNNSDQYHQPVLEALTAFVREGAKLRPTTPQMPTTPTTLPPPTTPPTDIQAALTVIGRRTLFARMSDGDPGDRVDLHDANLTGAELGAANLAMADLTNANLTGAHLSGAYLAHANLTGANLDFADLDFAYVRDAILRDADLTSTELGGATLIGADFTHADLTNAELTGADLTDATIEQTQLDQACSNAAKLPTGLTLKPKPCLVPQKP